MQSFTVRTHSRTEFLDITPAVRSAAEALGVKAGVLTVFVPHIWPREPSFHH